MRLITVSSNGKANFPKLSLSIANSPEQIKEVQQLRYKVFVEAAGLPSLRNSDGLECDEFDEFCDHLIVRDTRTSEVVGTYRVLSRSGLNKTKVFYSEKEFNLEKLSPIRDSIIEAGRACIHPDYRHGGVIMMLWSGLASCMQRDRAKFLIGCASISLSDGGNSVNSLYRKLADEHLCPEEYRVSPKLKYEIQDAPEHHVMQVPPLIKGYLRSGAWICSEPAWDPDFHTADLFMMLPLFRLDSRYARHYLKDSQAV
jgi:putative hemolysin